MTKVMIVESPNKIKSITKYLGELGMGDIHVLASAGHIRDLPKNELGVDTTTFVPTYVITPEKTALVAKLKSALVGATEVYLATDPDREGEAIAWHLFEALGIRKSKVLTHRVKFGAIDKKSILAGMTSLGQIDMQLMYAQEARRVLDRLVGYMVSPRLGGKLSAGRVQSPSLRLVVEREAEILAFKPLGYFDVKANIQGETNWHASWQHDSYREKGQTYWLDETVANAVATVTQLTVTSVAQSQRNAKAPAPFTTSSLQQAASSALKMSPGTTMDVAQKLFALGAISYHRTDSPNLSASSITEVISALKAANLPYADKPNQWPVKGGAQEAHEAIRPTNLSLAFAGESQNEQALYQLIKQRTLACQMPDAIFHVTTILFDSNVVVPIDNKIATFKAHGEVATAQTGWMGLLAKPQEQEEDDQVMQALPVVKEGDIAMVLGEVVSKKTTPPSRYTEAALIKKLENLEIGRPSTYASITETIKRRDYVIINSKRQLEPTEKGNGVIAVLKGANFSFLEYNWTKEIEQRLDAIAQGTDKYVRLVADIHKVLEAELKGLPEGSRGGYGKTKVEGMTCHCGGAVEESDKAYECPDCKAIIWKVTASRKISKKEATALFHGDELADLPGFISKSKKEFSAGLKMSVEGKLEFFFADAGPRSSSPGTAMAQACQCGGVINKTERNWSCQACDAIVWATISSRPISDDEAITLLQGGSVEMTGLLSKAQKAFNATVVMKDGKTAFEFS